MDLAETVDDLICIFDGAGDTSMDTLAMFIFGWLLAALFVLWLSKLVYNRFIVRALDKTTIDAAPVAASTPVVAAVEVVDAGAKKISPTSSSPVISAGASRSRAVPATPPVRRRLTRQSPAPELKKAKYVPAPTTTGADNISVLWVNDVFQWLYNDHVVLNELVCVWLQTLNEYCMKSMVEEGIGLEFVRHLPDTQAPQLSNVFSECASNDDVTITCDCDATPAFQLKCFRQKGEKTEISHYRANLNRFRARLNIFCVSEKLLADVKCDGWPEIKIALAPVGNLKQNLDETQLQELISEIASNALRNTEVHFNLAAYASCPRLVRHVAPLGRPHYDYQMNQQNQSDLGDKRLLVKVVKASQLGASNAALQPFCIVEMDEPPQKNQTGVQKNTDCPNWDEHFLFDITPNTAEILFEVYDYGTSPHKFLGLGIVGVEELLINPSQRQIISLQSRPYESDQVTGTLTVEFMFIEGPDIQNLQNQGHPMRIKETIRNVLPVMTKTTGPNTTTYQSDKLMNGDHLTTAALQDIDRNRDTINNTQKSTLVIHSVQRQPSQRLVKVELSDGTWTEIERTERPIDEDGNEGTPEEVVAETEIKVTEVKPENGVGNGTNGTENGGQPSGVGEVSKTNTLQSNATSDTDYRGRTRKRRDFFGTIKRRLGRSKGRSKSAGPGEDENGRDDSLNRSISADRSRQEEGFRLGIPGRTDMENSRRSSISEASGLSSASTRTYINEASTLVLETIENGIKKHYLVPLSLAQKSKWRKKGNKLHIFNDHTFVAKHLTGGTVCQVCSKSIARRIGKQGYECRDCLLKCHKHCHVKVNDNCPTSTIHNIELSYIQNPYTDKNLRML